MNKLRAIVLLCLLAAASNGNAAGLALFTPVSIDPASKISDAVRNECRLDYELQNNILQAMRRYDPEVATTTDPSTGQVLRVTITYVLGVGGGAFTGPKVVAVQSEYLKDGKVEFTAKMHRRSSMFGPFKGTCQLLDGASKGLAKIVAKWANQPKNSAKDEGEETSEPASASPAVASGASGAE